MNKWQSVLDAHPEYVFIPFAKPVSRNPICTFVSDIYRCSNSISYNSMSANSSIITYSSINNDSSISYNDTRNGVDVIYYGDAFNAINSVNAIGDASYVSDVSDVSDVIGISNVSGISDNGVALSVHNNINNDSNQKYSFTQDEITMPLINLNNYVKTNNYSEQKIEALKLERRKYKNRGYSRIARLKKKMNAPKTVIYTPSL